MRLLLKASAAVVGAVLVAYLLLVGVVAASMWQSPGTFGQVMARVPMPLMMAIPFEPIWMRARAGTLQPGDPAPEFSLPTIDKSRRVTLSEFRGRKPVALVFGSYT
jgi:hypothetical protein